MTLLNHALPPEDHPHISYPEPEDKQINSKH